jgi:hypothetical protein
MFVLLLLSATWLLTQHVGKEELNKNKLLLLVTTLMRDISYYTPEKNVSGVSGAVAKTLVTICGTSNVNSVLKFLYFYISTFRNTCAVPNMAVFCSSLILCFPGVLLRYFQNNFEMVPVACTINDVTFVFTFHVHGIFILRSFCLKILSVSSFFTLASP